MTCGECGAVSENQAAFPWSWTLFPPFSYKWGATTQLKKNCRYYVFSSNLVTGVGSAPGQPPITGSATASSSRCFIKYHMNLFVGWFRQCDLIPYSKDVDIGIWITDYNDQLISSMQNNGLQLIHRFGKVSFKDTGLHTVNIDLQFC